MDYNNLIQAYLDNSLDPQAESQLFMLLSTNEDLRSEFKQSIAFEKNLSKRISAYVPSSTATLGIFSKLGIGAAAGAATTVAAIGFKQGLMSFLANYSQAIITGLVTVLVTTAGFITFHNPPDKAENLFSTGFNSGNLTEFFNNNSGNTQEHSKGYPYIISHDTETVSAPDTLVKYVHRNIIVYKDAIPQIDNINGLIPHANNSKNELIGTSSIEMVNNLRINSDSEPVRLSDDYSELDVNLLNNISAGVAVELKGNGYWSIVHPEVPQFSSSILSNMQLSALYNTSKKFRVGFDLRQESFYQNFSGTNDLGEEFSYKQYPSYISLGLIGRYDILSSEFAKTFIQLGIGGTITGIIGRGAIGFELMPLSNISFNLAVEGSNLFYFHQGSMFNSPKIGLSYGVSFNF
jgi:hypothetical protein